MCILSSPSNHMPILIVLFHSFVVFVFFSHVHFFLTFYNVHRFVFLGLLTMFSLQTSKFCLCL
jgi:hypothetical protein